MQSFRQGTTANEQIECKHSPTQTVTRKCPHRNPILMSIGAIRPEHGRVCTHKHTHTRTVMYIRYFGQPNIRNEVNSHRIRRASQREEPVVRCACGNRLQNSFRSRLIVAVRPSSRQRLHTTESQPKKTHAHYETLHAVG